MPHTEPRDYFVSLVRGKRRALLAGPFTSHTAALVYVPFARAAVSEADPWSDFDAIGTCSMPSGSGRVGVLNGALKIVVKYMLTVCTMFE